MTKLQVITALSAIAAVASAIGAQVGVLSPNAAAWIMLIGAVAAAASGAIHTALESSVIVTVIGVGTAISTVLAQQGGIISANKSQIFLIVGTALAAIGKSLFGFDGQSSEVK